MKLIVTTGFQGCYDEAMELLHTARYEEGDQVIIAGDLIGWGPKPAECVKWARNTRGVYTIMGNQDLEFAAHAAKGASTKMWASTYYTSERLGEAGAMEAGKYFNTQPLSIKTPYATVVHAALDLRKPMEDQSAQLMVGGVDQLEKDLETQLGMPWYAAHLGRNTIITAHRNMHWELKKAGMSHGLDGKLLGRDGEPFVFTNENGGRVISLDTSGYLGMGKNVDQSGTFSAMVFEPGDPLGKFVKVVGKTDYAGAVRQSVTKEQLEGVRLGAIGMQQLSESDAVSIGRDREAYRIATAEGVNRALDAHRAKLAATLEEHKAKVLLMGIGRARPQEEIGGGGGGDTPKRYLQARHDERTV